MNRDLFLYPGVANGGKLLNKTSTVSFSGSSMTGTLTFS